MSGPEELSKPNVQGDLCLTLWNCKLQNFEAALGKRNTQSIYYRFCSLSICISFETAFL